MPHVGKAFTWFEENIEEIGTSESLLYVGVRHDMRSWWHDTLCRRLGAKRVGVIEIFSPNVADFERKQWLGEYDLVNQIIKGDVRQVDKYVSPGEYDTIFFDHGPEHLEEKDLRETIEKMKNIFSKIICCGPWGPWPQGPEDGNSHEAHVCVLDEELFRSMGFTSVTINGWGVENEGEIISYWKA